MAPHSFAAGPEHASASNTILPSLTEHRELFQMNGFNKDWLQNRLQAFGLTATFSILPFLQIDRIVMFCFFSYSKPFVCICSLHVCVCLCLCMCTCMDVHTYPIITKCLMGTELVASQQCVVIQLYASVCLYIVSRPCMPSWKPTGAWTPSNWKLVGPRLPQPWYWY